MKIQFLGTGSAFTMKNFQTNALITATNGKRMLLDCGMDIRFALREAGLGYRDINAVYLSHAHADHIGGMEFLAFTRFFDKSAGGPPDLFCVKPLIYEIWDNSLKGGLQSIEGQVMHLTNSFHCHPIEPNDSFIWEDVHFTPVQTIHVVDGFRFMHSYGLLIRAACPRDFGDTRPIGAAPKSPTIFYTSDTQYAPHQLAKFYSMADIIFHDCETAPFQSKVHAHYDNLKILPDITKAKMWLTHFQDDPPQNPVADGFKGFVTKGQTFEF